MKARKKTYQVVSREQAIKNGLSVYFTGKSCKHGHTDKRYTSTGHCLECLRLRALNDRMAIKRGRELAGIS